MDAIEVTRVRTTSYEGFTICDHEGDELHVLGPGATLAGTREHALLRVPYEVMTRAADRLAMTLPCMWPGLVIASPAAAHALRSAHELEAVQPTLAVTAVARCILEVVRALPRSYEHTSLRLARAYLQTHYGDKVELAEVARAARICKYQLVHLFSARLGSSPFRYLAELRLARARTLLERGTPCVEVAHAVGFCDQSHLNRWFKRRFGTSPAAYSRAVAATPRPLGTLDCAYLGRVGVNAQCPVPASPRRLVS